MALIGARTVTRRGLGQRVGVTIVGLVLAATVLATAGVAAQELVWQRNPGTGHWYALVQGVVWADGEAFALSVGGHLATVNDESEDRWIAATFQQEALIGFNDLQDEGTWVWVSGETVTYTNWLPEEPLTGPGADTRDVVRLNFDESGTFGWMTANIDELTGEGNPTPLLIEVESPVAPAANLPTGSPGHTLDWLRNPDTGHWYAVVQDMSWADGEAYAISIGGHLATINDEAEDRWISATFPDELLIGFNDIEHEGTWVWVSGETVTYTNWLPEEPSGVPGPGDPPENVAQINYAARPGDTGWNDTWVPDLPLLIEVVASVAPPAQMPTAPPTASPTAPQTPSPTQTAAPNPSNSPTPAASPTAVPSPSPQPTIVVVVIGGGGSGEGYRLADPAVPVISRFIPTPADLMIDPAVIWTNLLLAAVVMVMLIVATELLNRSLGELEPVLLGKFPVVRRLQHGLARLNAATLQRVAARRHRLVDIVRLAAIAALYGVVFALLDPTWDPLTVSGLWLVVMMALAAGVVGLGGDIAAWAVGRRWGVVGDLEIRAGSLLAAVGSTLVSRALVVVPGIMIGSPEVIEVDPERVDRRRLGIIATVGIGTVLLIGVGAWGLTLATSALRGTGGLDATLAGMEAFLLLLFAFAVQNAFVQLLSLRQSGGLALRRTHPFWWAVALLLVTFIFWQTLVNPGGDLETALRTRNALVFLAVAGLVLFVSLAVWVGTRLTWLRVAETVDSGAVRAIDLQRKYSLGPKALADELGLDTGLAKALRWQLGIEDDPACRHDFVFGKMKVAMYSDKAVERIRRAIAGDLNLADVRRAYEAAGRP